MATARAGNVIGGGDWARDRIVPDTMRAFIKGNPLSVRNPLATSPWQYVLEPLVGYLMLCQGLMHHPKFYSEAWNFGPDDSDVHPVFVLADIMVDSWRGASSWCLDESAHPHEAHSLKLDCSKAKNKVKWKPTWNLRRPLRETVHWCKAWSQKEDMRLFTLQQINRY